MLKKIIALMLTAVTAVCTYSVNANAEGTVPQDKTEDVQFTTDLANGTSKVSVFIRQTPDKMTYRIGEELDLTGGQYDVYEVVTFPDGNNMYADMFYNEMAVDGKNVDGKNIDGFSPFEISIDTSKFDSTKAGNYPIYITATNLNTNDSDTQYFNVTVMGDEELSATESTTTEIYIPEGVSDILGDANGDFRVSISDSVTILQYLANANKYPLDEWQKINADCYNTGDGITGMDAQAIQELDANGYSAFVESDGVLPDPEYKVVITDSTVSIKSCPDKLTYNIGEELDLTGGIYDVNTIVKPDDFMEYSCRQSGDMSDIKIYDGNYEIGLPSYVDISMDISAFDNTKAGVYPIFVRVDSGNEHTAASFEVTVR